MSLARKHRIFIVGNHPVCRHGMAQIVNGEADLVVCGEAAVTRQAVDAARDAKADLILMDFLRDDSAGTELLKRVREDEEPIALLIISSETEAVYALTLLQAGARGYVVKTEGLNEFLAAIRKVLTGDVYLNRLFGEKIISRLARGETETRGAGGIERLTVREREVLRLIGSGRSNKQVADDLKLSPKTVETHRLHIKEKLGLATSAELVHFAVTNLQELK